ncbi:MAG: peptidyl-prolyl cis-trans isomerase [Candidatus Omnitrophica bacterium]|nr:peptidyl-prolyl cis-trans isomerase [Candidatus Omnitrophota bacterium]
MFRRILRSKTIQNRTRWILAIVMVPPFAFFFHLWTGNRATSGPGGSAGVLFGHQVPWETFQEEYGWLRRNASAQLGTIPQGLETYFRRQAWDRLMLKEEARRRVTVSDEELAQDLREQPTFQQDGRFAPALYFRFVQSLGLTPQAFEARLRDDLRVEKLLERIQSDVTLTEEDVKTAYAKERRRLRASLIPISSSAFESTVKQTLTEQALRDFYTAHPEAVRRSAKRTIEYLGRSLSELLQDQPPVTDEERRAYYEEHQDDFTRDDGTLKPLDEARLAVEQGAKGAQVQTRLTNLALDLEEDRERGLRFVEIALSRGLRATRIGPIERSASAPTVAGDGPTAAMLAGAFDVPLGMMTQAFNTPVGVFLLMPVEEVPAQVAPFEEVRNAITTLLTQERAREAAKARAQALREQCLAKRQSGLTAAEIYLVLGVKPLRPAPFTRRGPVEGLTEAAKVAEALAGVPPGTFSEVLETPDGFAVAFVEERLPFDEAQWTADRETFRQTLLETTRQERLAQWLESLRAKARLKSFLDSS